MILVDTLKFLKTAAEKTAEIGWNLEVRYDKDTTRYYSRHVHEIGLLACLLGNLISTLTNNAITRITTRPGEYDYIKVDFESFYLDDYREACDMLKLAIDLDKTLESELTMYAEKVEKLARLAAAYEARKKGK